MPPVPVRRNEFGPKVGKETYNGATAGTGPESPGAIVLFGALLVCYFISSPKQVPKV